MNLMFLVTLMFSESDFDEFLFAVKLEEDHYLSLMSALDPSDDRFIPCSDFVINDLEIPNEAIEVVSVGVSITILLKAGFFYDEDCLIEVYQDSISELEWKSLIWLHNAQRA